MSDIFKSLVEYTFSRGSIRILRKWRDDVEFALNNKHLFGCGKWIVTRWPLGVWERYLEGEPVENRDLPHGCHHHTHRKIFLVEECPKRWKTIITSHSADEVIKLANACKDGDTVYIDPRTLKLIREILEVA